jgi:hypothetical protein
VRLFSASVLQIVIVNRIVSRETISSINKIMAARIYCFARMQSVAWSVPIKPASDRTDQSRVGGGTCRGYRKLVGFETVAAAYKDWTETILSSPTFPESEAQTTENFQQYYLDGDRNVDTAPKK